MGRYPTAFGRLLGVADRLAAPPMEVAVIGRRGDASTRALVATALAPFHRNRTVAGRGPDERVAGVPVLEGRGLLGERATAYLCSGYACRAPVNEPAALAEQIRAG